MFATISNNGDPDMPRGILRRPSQNLAWLISDFKGAVEDGAIGRSGFELMDDPVLCRIKRKGSAVRRGADDLALLPCPS
jgi:hypothetical protein